MVSKVQLSLYPDFHEIEEMKIIKTGSDCHFENLKNNTHYYWRIKNINEFNGSESEWSDICSFTTIVESEVIIINNDISIIYEFSNIEILPKVCEAIDGELQKNRCHPELETPKKVLLGACYKENKVLTNC